MSSYNIAEPSAVKRLKADGKVVDDNGNVINEGDYWQKRYDEAEPKIDKILHSDGSITDSEGNTIQDSTAFNLKKYTQAEPIPAKYLHSDGTIDENPGSGGGGGGEKASAYVWKVEYYHDYDLETYCFRLNFDKVPENLNVDDICYLYVQSGDKRYILIQKLIDDEVFFNLFDFTITKVSDSEFKLNCKSDTHGEITEREYIFTRGYEPFKDITLWELSE